MPQAQHPTDRTGPTGPTESSVRTAHAVRVGLGRLRRRLREHYDHSELTASQTSVLSRLDRDGPASASALATAEKVRPQSVALSIAALLERGLVERHPDPEDGRRQVVSATVAGHDVVPGARAAGESWLAGEIEARLTEAERRTVLDAMTLLDRLADA